MVVYVVYKLRASRKAFVMALMAIIWWQFLALVATERSGDQLFLELAYVYRYPWLFFNLFVLVFASFLSFDVWRKKFKVRYLLYLLTLAIGFSFFLQEARMAVCYFRDRHDR